MSTTIAACVVGALSVERVTAKPEMRTMMAEKWQRWMPFHIDRWRGSPSVQAMHPAAQMGYLNLLCSCWQSSDCCVSVDPIDLATESRLGDDLWAQYGPRILRKFVCLQPPRWRNEVLFAEWDEARRVYEKRKSGAVRTNESRSAYGERTHTERRADTRTLTETLTNTKTKEPKQKPAAGAAFVLPEWIDQEAWDGYEAMRRKMRKPMTDRARELAVRELEKLRALGSPPTAVLNQSVMNSWQGLFELKTGGNNGQIQPKRFANKYDEARAELDREDLGQAPDFDNGRIAGSARPI